jgi:hypothetical protein
LTKSHPEQLAMSRGLGFLIVTVFLAGCTSTGKAPPMPAMYAGCDQPIVAWCASQYAR